MKLHLVSIVLIACALQIARADDYEDAIKTYGPAQEKIEKESKRAEEWRYPGLSLVFKNGALAAPKEIKAAAPPARRETAPDLKSAKGAITEQVLGEILGSIPSEEAKDGQPAGPRPPAMPFVPR